MSEKEVAEQFNKVKPIEVQEFSDEKLQCLSEMVQDKLAFSNEFVRTGRSQT